MPQNYLSQWAATPTAGLNQMWTPQNTQIMGDVMNMAGNVARQRGSDRRYWEGDLPQQYQQMAQNQYNTNFQNDQASRMMEADQYRQMAAGQQQMMMGMPKEWMQPVPTGTAATPGQTQYNNAYQNYLQLMQAASESARQMHENRAIMQRDPMFGATSLPVVVPPRMAEGPWRPVGPIRALPPSGIIGGRPLSAPVDGTRPPMTEKGLEDPTYDFVRRGMSYPR